MSKLVYFEKFLIRLLSAVLNVPFKDLVYLNYNQLNPQNFKAILNTFNHPPIPDQIALMQTQFNFYSRDDSDTTPFVSDKADKQKKITPEIKSCVEPELTELYCQLERSERNLV